MSALPEEYREWEERSGIRLDPRVVIARDAGRGYFAAATGAVPAGAVLLEVPLRACLDLNPDHPAVAAFSAAPPLCRSALALLLHLPRLGPHAAALAAVGLVPTVISWGPEQCAMLNGTSLAGAHAALPLRDRFREHVLPVLGTGAAPAPLAGTSEDDFIRAATWVMSRGFHAPGAANAAKSAVAAAVPLSAATATSPGPFLIPVCDFFNFDPARAATHLCRMSSTDAASAAAGGGPAAEEAECFRYYALRDIAVGEEVFVSYGKLSDAQLLHTYGFVVEPPVRSELVTVAFAAVDEGGAAPDTAQAVSVPGLLRSFSFPRCNPHDTATVTFGDLRSALVSTLEASGAAGARRTRALLRATRVLREGAAAADGGNGSSRGSAVSSSCGVSGCGGGGIVPDGGFTLQLQGPPAEGAAAMRALWGAADPAALLALLLPAELLTAAQVLLMAEDALGDYVAAAREVAPAPLLLPAAPPSALLERRERLFAAASASRGARTGGPAPKRRRVEGGGGDSAGRAVNASTAAEEAEAAEAEEEADDPAAALEEVESSLDEAADLWTLLLKAVSGALARYPLPLKADREWLQAVQAHREQDRGADSKARTAQTAATPGGPPAAAAGAPLLAPAAAAAAGCAACAAAVVGAPRGSVASSPWFAEPPERQALRGAQDPLYRSCRLLAMREKELLTLVKACITAELMALAAAGEAEEEEEGSDSIGDSGGASEEGSGEEHPSGR